MSGTTQTTPPAGGGEQQPAPQAPTAWHTGASPEILGHLQNHGWADKPANEVALAAVEAHRQAAKLIGVPPDQVVRLPQGGAQDPAWKAVWQRLGAPADAAGYDLSAVKFTDGEGLSPEFADFFRAAAANLNLPQAAAVGLAGEFAKFLEGQDVRESTEKDGILAQQKSKLAANWGSNFEANKFVAGQAARALGVTGDEVQALEKQIGYDRVMDLFLRIGQSTGEAKYVQGGPGGDNQGRNMTREQAIARKGDLMKDMGWTKRWGEGGVAEQREMLSLNMLISGDAGQY